MCGKISVKKASLHRSQAPHMDSSHINSKKQPLGAGTAGGGRNSCSLHSASGPPLRTHCSLATFSSRPFLLEQSSFLRHAGQLTLRPPPVECTSSRQSSGLSMDQTSVSFSANALSVGQRIRSAPAGSASGERLDFRMVPSATSTTVPSHQMKTWVGLQLGYLGLGLG